MADVTFRINTESTKALNDFSKLTLAQQKMDIETKKLNNSLQRQSQQFEKNGKFANKGGAPGGPNLTPYIPGGGAPEQFKNALGALGISGLAGAVISLKNAIDTNTKSMLDKAKKEQEAAKKLAPSALYQGKDPRFQGEYQQVRNSIAQQTATPLEDIDKLNSSFSAIVESADDLKNVISSVAIGSKLNLGSIDELTKLEQKNISEGGVAGGAVFDLNQMNSFTNGASQVKEVLDEIALFKNQNMGFALGTNLIKTDAVNAEENLKLLASFQEKGSNENLRSYMRIGDDVEGDAMFEKFFSFVNKKSTKLGMSKDEVVDNIVKQGDLDQGTGDALKAVMSDMQGFNTYLREFTVNSNSSQDSLKGMIRTLDELKDANVSFKDAFEADKRLVDAEIIKTSPDKSVNSTKFNDQLSLTERARKSGLYSQLVNEEGVVDDTVMNRTTIYNEENKGIPFVTNAAKYQKELREEKAQISERMDKGTESLGDYFQYGYNSLQQINPMSGGFGSAERAQKQFDEGPQWVKDLFTVGMEDIPVFGAAMTYKQSGGKLLPGMYDSLDATGGQQSSFSLGALGHLGLDVATLGGGGIVGKRLGASSGLKKSIGKVLGDLDKVTNKELGRISEEAVESAIESLVKQGASKDEAFDAVMSMTNSQLGLTDEVVDMVKKVIRDDVVEQTLDPKYMEKVISPFLEKGISNGAKTGRATGIVGGEIVRNSIQSYYSEEEPARTQGGNQVYNSFENNSRDNIDVSIPKQITEPITTETKISNTKLDQLIELQKQNLVVNTTALEENKKIKEQLFNLNQKPFIRNSVR